MGKLRGGVEVAAIGRRAGRAVVDPALSLLKNVIWLEIGSRVKIGMRIFINRMEHLVRWCDLGA
jgi:hypothetical protein